MSFRQQYLGGKCFTNRSLKDHETILNLEIGVTRLATAAPVAQVGFSGLSLSELETNSVQRFWRLTTPTLLRGEPDEAIQLFLSTFCCFGNNQRDSQSYSSLCLFEFCLLSTLNSSSSYSGILPWLPRERNFSTYEILAVDAWNPIFSRATRPSFLEGDLRAFCPPPR